MNLYSQQQEMGATMDEMRDSLGVDIYGWVPNEEFTTTRELARNIKERMIEAADPADKDGVRDHSPFEDYEDD